MGSKRVERDPETGEWVKVDVDSKGKAGGQAAPQRKFFQSQDGLYGSKVTLDGATFYFDLPSAAAKEYDEAFPDRCAEVLGFDRDILVSMSPEEVAGALDEKQQRQLRDLKFDQWEHLLNDALRNWTGTGVPFDRSIIPELYPDLKRDIYEAIGAFAGWGISEARFRQGRG